MTQATTRPKPSGRQPDDVVPVRCITQSRDQIAMGRFDLRAAEHGEVLVETTLSCVSPGTELRVWRLLREGKLDHASPIVPGYAKVGRVVDPGESGLPVGQRVVVNGTNDTGPFTKHWGGHVSHSLTHAESLVPIPDPIDDRQAALARLAAISYHGYAVTPMFREDRVAVIGLGAIGLFAAKFYACHGHDIVAMDRSPQRVALAKRWGIEAVQVDGPASAVIRDRCEGGANLIVDATGVPAVAADAVESLRMPPWQTPVTHPSRYVVQGSYPADLPLPYEPFFQRETQVLFPRDWTPDDLRAIFKLIEDGVLSFPPDLYTEHDPTEAPSVYAALSQPDYVRVTALFRWQSA